MKCRWLWKIASHRSRSRTLNWKLDRVPMYQRPTGTQNWNFNGAWCAVVWRWISAEFLAGTFTSIGSTTCWTCFCHHKPGHSAVVCRNATKGWHSNPTEPPQKIRKESCASSGGAIGHQSTTPGDAFCAGALHGTTLSEDEMEVELEETPNGETSKPITGPPEELNASHTQGGPTAAECFSGMSLEDLFIIEICAGSARLSKVAHQCGFRTMAVDHSTARSCGFPICVFDLTDPDDLERMVQFLEESADSILGH